MNTSRGFIFPILMITIIVSAGVAIAWWIDKQQTAAIQASPGDSQTVNPDFRVTPTSGKAPLSVQFAVKRDLGTVETISYGDGTSATISDFLCGFQYCTRQYIYDKPGTYTAAYEDASGQALRSFAITVTQSP